VRGPIKHILDRFHDLAVKKTAVEKIVMKLNGNLVHILAGALMLLPAMKQVRSDKHEFEIANLLHTVADNTPQPLAILNKIDFVFRMEMYRVIEDVLYPVEYQKTVLI